MLKRATNRRLYPGLWECGGGKVNLGETFEAACIRQMQEEAGVKITDIHVFSTYSISIPNESQKVIPGVKFFATIENFRNGKVPVISEEHSEYRFITLEQVAELEFIKGLDRDILEAFNNRENVVRR